IGPHSRASMGPRFVTAEEVPVPAVRFHPEHCFNGAAVRHRGRASQVSQALLRARVASMGPRFVTAEEVLPLRVPGELLRASMGPRFVTAEEEPTAHRLA